MLLGLRQDSMLQPYEIRYSIQSLCIPEVMVVLHESTLYFTSANDSMLMLHNSSHTAHSACYIWQSLLCLPSLSIRERSFNL